MYFLNLCQTTGLLTLIKFIQNFLTLLQIAIPIGLIIYGSIDLGKAVIAGDEKEIQANQKVLLKRVMAAILVFFVITFVSLAMGLVGKPEWRECWEAAKKHTPSLD